MWDNPYCPHHKRLGGCGKECCCTACDVWRARQKELTTPK